MKKELVLTLHIENGSCLTTLDMLGRNHQQRKKKMVCKFNLGQLVDRHDSAMLTACFDASSTKYERAETSKLLASVTEMIAGGNIKTRTPNPCYGNFAIVQALLNDVGTNLIFKNYSYEKHTFHFLDASSFRVCKR